jgi:hypothetical protein
MPRESITLLCYESLFFLARGIIFAEQLVCTAVTDFLFLEFVYTVTIRIWDVWCLPRRIQVEIEGDRGV